MFSAIQIIKTLPHLHIFEIRDDISTLYSKNFTVGSLDYISSVIQFKKSEIKYTGLIKLINQINEDSQLKNMEFNELANNVKNSNDNYTCFRRVDEVTAKMEYSIKGDTITIWLPAYETPIKLEFFGEDCDPIQMIDLVTKRPICSLNSLLIGSRLPLDKGVIDDIFFNFVGGDEFNKIIFTSKPIEFKSRFFENYDITFIDKHYIFPHLLYSNKKAIISEIERLKENNYFIVINSTEIDEDFLELKEFCIENIPEEKLNSFKSFTQTSLKTLPAGFISDELKFAFLTDRELFGSLYLSKVKTFGKRLSNIDKLLRQFEGSILVGEHVVHEDYGVALYKGTKSEIIDGNNQDYLLLGFFGGDELYVPLSQIEKVTRFIGGENSIPELTKLGKGIWKSQTLKAKKQAFISAKELVNSIAKRELSKAMPINLENSDDYINFIKQFPFELTKDQITSIDEVLFDLSKDKPMNRLLIGDVGFGKTEVIMRATFKMLEKNSQVIILTPTTILATQHFITFTERFYNKVYNKKFKIALISRFNTPQENKELIDKANEGEIDILIGTHRVFSSDIKLPFLGLVVIDEEQKFGVKQKEKLKQLHHGSHVLNVSATPIPRTLSMALSSIQDISIITTPPINRKPVFTEIIYGSYEKASNEIQKEISKGGQVYFIHNEVKTIDSIVKKLSSMVPNVSFIEVHGQMNSKELNRRMEKFRNKEFDVLVSTSIIENGLDLTNVNTIIIHNAHKFGLSQLYQMRGRVGRSSQQGYCYLMCPNKINIDTKVEELIVKKNKQKLYLERLNSLVENQDLGAGFRIASKDLEIRGGGDILGAKQHGHISKVGYAYYIELLAKEIERIQSNLNE